MSRDVQEDTSDLWMRFMRRGEFEKAWEIGDAALKSRAGKTCRHLPRHFQYVWDGAPLDGKRVLVRCYHGLGDTIQFVRYAPLVKAIAAEVIVWAQPPLVPLLQTVSGIDRLLPLDDGAPEVDFDVEIMELPHVLRTQLSTIPAKVPYLQVEPLPLLPKNGQLAVGPVWQAGDWDEHRSIPFSLLAPLAKISGVTVYILQSGAKSAGWREEFGVDLGEFSLFDFARAVRAMDLLISVDSMPAHLAGALGVPVWNLLHADADWRWLENRADSPWYPTMRLFRQERRGEWESVIRRVIAELEKLGKSFKYQNIDAL